MLTTNPDQEWQWCRRMMDLKRYNSHFLLPCYCKHLKSCYSQCVARHSLASLKTHHHLNTDTTLHHLHYSTHCNINFQFTPSLNHYHLLCLMAKMFYQYCVNVCCWEISFCANCETFGVLLLHYWWHGQGQAPAGGHRVSYFIIAGNKLILHILTLVSDN